MRNHKVRTLCWLVLCCALSLWIFPAEEYYSAPELKEPLETLQSPGELSQTHLFLEGKENCMRCHPTPDKYEKELCLECHPFIKTRWDKSLGYHGRFLRGNCLDCHKEHKGKDYDLLAFDRQKFNHLLATFPLEGKHKVLECEACHRVKSGETGLLTTVYIGLPTQCNLCHPTPHKGEVSPECEHCHTTLGWKGRNLLFRHNLNSAFPLLGKHPEVACELCHPDGLFKPRPHQCADCHDDPHGGELGGRCQECHTSLGWTQVSWDFDHDTATSFALRGMHVGLSCDQCHPENRFKDTPQQCSSCHQDPHKGTLGLQCQQCHQELSWQSPYLVFDHNRDTGFPLLGSHQQVSCLECHKPESYQPRGSQCADCHLDPHGGELDAQCNRCHHLTDWEIPDFHHQEQALFDPGTLHADVACAECHPAKRYKIGSLSCEQCHTHETDFFKGMPPLLTDQLYTTSPKSTILACTDCHFRSDPGADRSLLFHRCTSCHPQDYELVASHWKHNYLMDTRRLSRLFLNLRKAGDSLPTSVQLVWTAEQKKITTYLKALQQMESMGLHNPWLVDRQLQFLEREYQRIRDFIIPSPDS